MKTAVSPAAVGRSWAERSASLRAPTRRDAVWALAALVDGPFVVVPDDAPGHDPNACLHVAGRCGAVSDADALAFCRAAAEVLRPRLQAFLERPLLLQDWERALFDLQQVDALLDGATFCARGCDAVSVDAERGLCDACAHPSDLSAL